MNFENFFAKLDSFTDKSLEKATEIKSHGLPIIIFGANWMARHIKNVLDSLNVEIEGFAVDSNYFKPNQTFLGLPVFDFSTLLKAHLYS